MQLTRAADYAVRVMIHLAGLPSGTRASPGGTSQRQPNAPNSFFPRCCKTSLAPDW